MPIVCWEDKDPPVVYWEYKERMVFEDKSEVLCTHYLESDGLPSAKRSVEELVHARLVYELAERQYSQGMLVAHTRTWNKLAPGTFVRVTASWNEKAE